MEVQKTNSIGFFAKSQPTRNVIKLRKTEIKDKF